MDDYSVKFTNEAQVLENIRALAGQIGVEGGKPQKVVAVEAKKGIQQGFRDSMSPEGVPWRENKTRLGGKILQDHRTLYHSIASEIQGNTVRVGTNDKRANTLHFGGKIVPTKGQYLSIMMPGMAGGNLRAQYPNAFVLKLGGKDYGYDRMWLVRRLSDIAGVGHTYKKEGKIHARNQNYRNSHDNPDHGRLQFIALLVKSVNMPGRPFIGMSLQTQDNVVARLTELAQKAWEGGDASST